MASLQLERFGHFHVIFRFQGKRYKRSLNTKSEAGAIARKEVIEETIRLLCNGRLSVPDNVNPADFILADGKLLAPEATVDEDSGATTPPPSLTLRSVFEQFFDSIPDGNLEQSTLDVMHLHERHFLRVLKPSFEVPNLSLTDLQQYVNHRTKDKTQFRVDAEEKQKKRTTVSPTTIKKEIATFGTVWRWAESASLVSGPFPRRGVRFPKTKESPPFQTWEEIERQIRRDQLIGREATLLWDALYLRRTEIDVLLADVRSTALYPFIYPMFVMAAHTGARRSEMLRSRPSDFDFDGHMVTIHERKRVSGKLTTRRVPMSPTLYEVMQSWIESEHPGGLRTFCHSKPVRRSRSKTSLRAPLSRDQAHDHFKRTLRKTKWKKLRGWHCLRHSFISNLASQGIDQRIIDEFVGHTTEQMRRRYRHLFPDVKRDAIDKVFG